MNPELWCCGPWNQNELKDARERNCRYEQSLRHAHSHLIHNRYVLSQLSFVIILTFSHQHPLLLFPCFVFCTCIYGLKLKRRGSCNDTKVTDWGVCRVVKGIDVICSICSVTCTIANKPDNVLQTSQQTFCICPKISGRLRVCCTETSCTVWLQQCIRMCVWWTGHTHTHTHSTVSENMMKWTREHEIDYVKAAAVWR